MCLTTTFSYDNFNNFLLVLALCSLRRCKVSLSLESKDLPQVLQGYTFSDLNFEEKVKNLHTYNLFSSPYYNNNNIFLRKFLNFTAVSISK